MTADATGHVMWSPDPVKQRLADSADRLAPTAPFPIRLPIRDITP